MDINIFLTICLSLISLVVIVLGVYLILLINEAQSSLRRVNRILDHLEEAGSFIEESLIKPASSLGSIATVVKEGVDFARDLKKLVAKEGKAHERE